MELTAAEPRRKSLTQLYLDGEPGPKVDTEVFVLSRLKPGDEVTQEELLELVERSDARRAREKDHLEEIGLIDDRAYGESYARELFLRKRFGARRVRQELARKGIDREIIDQVLSQYQEDGGEETMAGENIALVLSKKYPLWREDEKVRRRAVAALQRLGYTYGQIQGVMGELDEME